MIAFLVAAALGVLALIFVLGPLYVKGKKIPGRKVEQTKTVQLTEKTGEREQEARNALQEVELDYQLGNISGADYQTLREQYMRRALVALKSRYDREQDLDELIEDQLRKMKEGYEKNDAI